MNLPLLLIMVLALAAPPVPAAAQDRVPAVPPPPTEPGIFGAGFTNVTGTSARLVFTTSEPMAAKVTVAGGGREIILDGKDILEIHAFEIGDLSKDHEYVFRIEGRTRGGRTATHPELRLRPAHRAASSHRWPGFTIFATSVGGNEAAAYACAAQSGVRMIRMEVPWYGLLPDGRHVDPAYLERVRWQISELRKHRLEPLIVLDYCVPWAKPYTNTTMTWRHPSFGPPDRLDDWELYVRSVVSSLGGIARYYEVWNEPDAGYLSTGSYVERPGLPPPIGREPFKDNWNYWLGDRYAPMVAKVRAVLDEMQPGAVLLNGGWNRDYNGARGDLLFQRGLAPCLDIYAFHAYSRSPISFASWHQAIDGGFRRNIDRIFQKHGVSMPLAVTEWGWPCWPQPNLEKGFVTFRDAQIFSVKSAFYFLAMERVEILCQFKMGVGPDTRDKDPLFFMLVNEDAHGGLVFQPTFRTFSWIARTFGSSPYRAIPVRVTPSDHAMAFAIEIRSTGEIFLAAWQDGSPGPDGAISARPSREAEIVVEKFPAGSYAAARIDLEGAAQPEPPLEGKGGLVRKVVLPEVSAVRESEPVVLRFTPAGKPEASR